MRARQPVDYSALQTPGTPTWLKIGSKEHTSGAEPQNVNKENDRPAPLSRKGRAAKGMPAVHKEVSEKTSAKDKAAAQASDSQKVSGQDTPSEVAENAATAQAGKDSQKPGSLTDVPAKVEKEPSKARQRKSAPNTKQGKAEKATKRSSAPAKPASKRSLPELEREGPQEDKKRAKTSGGKGPSATKAAVGKEKDAKSSKAAQKSHGGTDSWSSGEDLPPAAEPQAAPEPASAKSTRTRSAAQQAEPAETPGAGAFHISTCSSV